MDPCAYIANELFSLEIHPEKKGKQLQVLGHVNGENVPIQTGL